MNNVGFTKDDIVKQWACVREHNHTIPSEVLDSMRKTLEVSLTGNTNNSEVWYSNESEQSIERRCGDNAYSDSEDAWRARSKATSLPALLSELQLRIMTLPCKMGQAIEMNEASRQVYKEGHRDARHAAVEIVMELAQRNEEEAK